MRTTILRTGNRDHLMRYHSSQQNIVWTVLLLLCTILSLNGCSDADNVTGPPPPVPLSPDAKLSSLTVTSGSLQPAFSSDVANYTVDVATSVTSVTVTAQPQDAGATVSINGQTTTSQSVSLGAPGSSTPIPIVVTALSGSQNTYIVTVNRTALAGNNNLQSLSRVAGLLGPHVYCEHEELHSERCQLRRQRHCDGATTGRRGQGQHQWADDDEPDRVPGGSGD